MEANILTNDPNMVRVADILALSASAAEMLKAQWLGRRSIPAR